MPAALNPVRFGNGFACEKRGGERESDLAAAESKCGKRLFWFIGILYYEGEATEEIDVYASDKRTASTYVKKIAKDDYEPGFTVRVELA